MHIPDGFISAPINAATAVISLGCCAAAVRQANRTLGERQVPLLGVTGAFIFAAQMINFPIAGGTSGHFLGAVLAAVLLGPLNACLVMGIVLSIQCLIFADGGLTALGSNVFNMGVVGGFLGYWVFSSLRALLPRSLKTLNGLTLAAAVAAWASVVLASVACALELAFSGSVPLGVALSSMALVHAVIGIGEAIITGIVVATVAGVRPDLLPAWGLPLSRPSTPAFLGSR